MDRPLLTHIYPHPTPAPPELYSLLPSPVHVTGSRVSPHVSGITAIEEDKIIECSYPIVGDTSKFVNNYEQGITRVKGGGYAFLMESTVLQYKVQASIISRHHYEK